MGKTIYITDKDALDVDRVIVSSTGMEYKLLYSCDEIDNYENRLKADLKAILVELQLEIEEMDSGCGWEGYRPTAQVIGLIQQKIDKLKEDKNGENNN